MDPAFLGIYLRRIKPIECFYLRMDSDIEAHKLLECCILKAHLIGKICSVVKSRVTRWNCAGTILILEDERGNSACLGTDINCVIES